jgi:pimeloyl-ACP methyl ester carboxylesterase
MKNLWMGVLGLVLVGCAAQPPIALRGMGSFHVGGRTATIAGKPVKEVVTTPGAPTIRLDPNGSYLVESMYAQYFLPAKRRGKVPLLLWHGGGLTGVTYESTPDGREGWLNYFVKQGWDTYVSDSVERGRSGWAMYPDIFPGEPVFLPKSNPWERFRIGPGAGSYSEDASKRKLLPGSQFPAEAYDNFMRQNVPRWTTTDAPTLTAYLALVDRICPCVIVVHSQGGQFGFRVAQERPDKVLALVAVEPTNAGEVAQVAALRKVPTLLVYGDNIQQDARWSTFKTRVLEFSDSVRKAGGSVDVLDLPAQGVRGNSHMMMMDRNNTEIAAQIQNWLVRKSLYD